MTMFGRFRQGVKSVWRRRGVPGGWTSGVASALWLALCASAARCPADAEVTPFLYARWHNDRQACVLSLNEGWADSLELESVHVEIQEVCRYDEAARRWQPFRLPHLHSDAIRIAPWPARQGTGDPELGVLARRTGPYWLRWTENDVPRAGLLYCLRMLCEDLMLGPEPVGQIAACLPEGRARFVPDPARGCRTPPSAPAEVRPGTDAPRQ